MSTSAHLYEQALASSVRADRCRSVADILDARKAALVERHRPVAALHSDEVWRGRAAVASRMRLRRVIGASLYYLGVDLSGTSGALRSEAARLDLEAADLRRRAAAAARAEAEAAAAAAADRERRLRGGARTP